MLTMTKSININGQSIVNNMIAMTYNATVECDNPKNVLINYYMSNQEAYKANRETCRADQKEFEEYVYALQDELLAGAEYMEITDAE